jgi:hypothetical protein
MIQDGPDLTVEYIFAPSFQFSTVSIHTHIGRFFLIRRESVIGR